MEKGRGKRSLLSAHKALLLRLPHLFPVASLRPTFKTFAAAEDGDSALLRRRRPKGKRGKRRRRRRRNGAERCPTWNSLSNRIGPLLTCMKPCVCAKVDLLIGTKGHFRCTFLWGDRKKKFFFEKGNGGGVKVAHAPHLAHLLVRSHHLARGRVVDPSPNTIMGKRRKKGKAIKDPTGSPPN